MVDISIIDLKEVRINFEENSVTLRYQAYQQARKVALELIK